MDHRSMTAPELTRLHDALKRNVDDGTALFLKKEDTSFAGEGTLPRCVSEHEPKVIEAIRSVPMHY